MKYGDYGENQTVKVISHSINYWRLQALENIEMRLSEAASGEALGQSRKLSQRPQRTPHRKT